MSDDGESTPNAFEVKFLILSIGLLGSPLRMPMR